MTESKKNTRSEEENFDSDDLTVEKIKYSKMMNNG